MLMLKDRVDELQDKLGTVAGEDPLQDRFTAGAIAGYHDLLRIDYAEVSND